VDFQAGGEAASMESTFQAHRDRSGDWTWRLAIKSITVHITVWVLVLILGPIATVLSPITRGQIVFWLGLLWSKIIMGVAGVKLEIEGLEKVKRGQAQVLVGNHASNFDIYVMIISLRRHYYRFVAKKEILYIPIFGWALWAGRFPFVDRQHNEKAQKTMKRLAQRVKRTGLSILAFPEGTRNRTARLMPFKKGPFVLAIDLGVPLVPFVIHGAQRVQGRHKYLVRSGTIRVEFLDRIETAGMTYEDRDRLIESVRGDIERRLLEDEQGTRGDTLRAHD
jgi:1-acyl-sn-glycerol-3-phosphate acyltransferase